MCSSTTKRVALLMNSSRVRCGMHRRHTRVRCLRVPQTALGERVATPIVSLTSTLVVPGNQAALQNNTGSLPQTHVPALTDATNTTDTEPVD